MSGFVCDSADAFVNNWPFLRYETLDDTEVWEPESVPYRLLLLDSLWLDHGCKRDAYRRCVFVGGLTISCVIEQTRPPTWRGIGIRVSEEGVPTEFLLGKMAEIV